jgi:hypothetical protein
MLTSVDLGRMAANLRLADNTHQRVDECIALISPMENNSRPIASEKPTFVTHLVTR